MVYLTTHSTHFIYGYMEGRKEMFYLTMHSLHFYLQLYGFGHMTKDHSDTTWANQTDRIAVVDNLDKCTKHS